MRYDITAEEEYDTKQMLERKYLQSRAKDMSEYWTGTLFGDMIDQALASKDTKRLEEIVQRAEEAVHEQDTRNG